jgi:hypothetical protein
MKCARRFFVRVAGSAITSIAATDLVEAQAADLCAALAG